MSSLVYYQKYLYKIHTLTLLSLYHFIIATRHLFYTVAYTFLKFTLHFNAPIMPVQFKPKISLITRINKKDTYL